MREAARFAWLPEVRSIALWREKFQDFLEKRGQEQA